MYEKKQDISGQVCVVQLYSYCHSLIFLSSFCCIHAVIQLYFCDFQLLFTGTHLHVNKGFQCILYVTFYTSYNEQTSNIKKFKTGLTMLLKEPTWHLIVLCCVWLFSTNSGFKRNLIMLLVLILLTLLDYYFFFNILPVLVKSRFLQNEYFVYKYVFIFKIIAKLCETECIFSPLLFAANPKHATTCL